MGGDGRCDSRGPVRSGGCIALSASDEVGVVSCIFWFDVEDMFHYARSNARPSGIQRVTFQIYAAMQHGYGGTGRVRFVRHGPDGQSLVPIDWEVLERTFSGIANASTVAPEPSTAR